MHRGILKLLALVLALAIVGPIQGAKETEEDDAQILRLWRRGFNASKNLQPLLDTWVTDRPCTRKSWGIGCSLIDGEQRVTSIELILKGNGPDKVYLETEIPGTLADLPLKTLRIVGQSSYPSCRIYGDGPGNLPGALWKDSSSLSTLVITRCQMEGRLPTHTALPPNLETLDLSYNRLTGDLLGGWVNLKRLKAVNLEGNRLDGELLEAKWMPQNIQEYNVGANGLTGDIPNWSSLTKLRNIYLQNNTLTGPLPAALPTNLLNLNLQFNRIGGSLPKWTANQALQILFLAGNKLTGTVPDLSALKGLQELYLDGNSMTGQLGAVFPSSLMTLWLNNNAFSGSVPSLPYLDNLVDLNLGFNQLTTPPPAAFLPPKLQSLNLQGNQFKGFMPNYSARPSLGLLDLSQNQLKGTLPGATLLPAGLQNLDLSDNNFIGQLPKDWAGLSHIATANVQYNTGLSGQIPTEWGQAGALRVIDNLVLKPGTGLCGSIPGTLQGKVTNGQKELGSLGP
ncbi:hypothetical protein N2152v2_002732 [Parachlorella kessleri]